MGKTNYKIYTPSKCSELIVLPAIENYFKGIYSKKKLNSIKIIDLSCGTGNLLSLSLEKLIELSFEITGKYFYNPKWIIGIDVDIKASFQYKKSISDILNKYNLKGEARFKHADGLLTDIKEKYDIVLGNPPYIGEKNNKDLFKKIRHTTFGRRYYESKMDYFYFFIEKAIEILKPNGFISYITTNYWLKADSGKILRDVLKKNGRFIEIDNFNTSVFEDAPGQHNIIFLWQKIEDKSICENIDFKVDVKLESLHFSMKEKDLYSSSGRIRLIKEKDLEFNEKIEKKSNYKLKDLFFVNQGIISGCDKAFVLNEYDENFKEYLRPLYKNKDIQKYSYNKKNKFWILYINNSDKINDYLKSHLIEYKDKLEKRREVKSGKISWHELQWARSENIFLDEKIVVRQRCKTNLFAYSKKPFYGSADIYFLTLKNKKINIFYILGYLNSDVFYRWYKLNGKSKGYNLEFYSTPLKEIPIFYPKNKSGTSYIEALVKEQIKNYSEDTQNQINIYFKNLFK